jgi:hypothetical protein
MSRLCLINGQSQYRITHTFIDRLTAAYRQTGHEEFVVNMLQKDWSGTFPRSFAELLALAFSFNAVGADVETGDVSVCNDQHFRPTGRNAKVLSISNCSSGSSR